MSELSNVVNNDVVKKRCVWWVSHWDKSSSYSWFVLKTQYNTHKSCLEKKIDGADKKSTWY